MSDQSKILAMELLGRWAVKLAKFAKATVHRPEELTQVLGIKPCGASTYLEGYGVVHCDQSPEHGSYHCGPVFTEHSWEQEKAG